jgi:ABC-type branched-subunit amino acid transport system permease subunit
MLVGLALMLLMIFRPQGIFGDPRRWRSMPADQPHATP